MNFILISIFFCFTHFCHLLAKKIGLFVPYNFLRNKSSTFEVLYWTLCLFYCILRYAACIGIIVIQFKFSSIIISSISCLLLYHDLDLSRHDLDLGHYDLDLGHYGLDLCHCDLGRSHPNLAFDLGQDDLDHCHLNLTLTFKALTLVEITLILVIPITLTDLR